MSKPVINLSFRPDSQHEIAKLADDVLRKAGAAGILPTPIDDLLETAGVRDETDHQTLMERFRETLAEPVRDKFHAVLQKVRGIADLRERSVYVPVTSKPSRILFTKGHELGHQVIPWHHVNTAYQDDDLSLSQEAEDYFDIEANFFSAEVIFQGHRFRQRALDYNASLETAFQLASDHRVSRHATIRRFVEEHDETVALVPFYPSRYILDDEQRRRLTVSTVTCSPRFKKNYSDIELPDRIDSSHPWSEARNNTDEICGGEIRLICDSSPVRFQWQSWWNTYCLLVLLRRKPALSLVSRS